MAKSSAADALRSILHLPRNFRQPLLHALQFSTTTICARIAAKRPFHGVPAASLARPLAVALCAERSEGSFHVDRRHHFQVVVQGNRYYRAFRVGIREGLVIWSVPRLNSEIQFLVVFQLRDERTPRKS